METVEATEWLMADMGSLPPEECKWDFEEDKMELPWFWCRLSEGDEHFNVEINHQTTDYYIDKIADRIQIAAKKQGVAVRGTKEFLTAWRDRCKLFVETNPNVDAGQK